jgi:pimeloyl-ACP methyl ester carboxylesterase
MMKDRKIQPFSVDLSASAADFQQRLRGARWPGAGVDGAPPWAYGTSASYLRSLVDFATGAVEDGGFDWRAAQDRLNSLPQFTANVPNRRSPGAGDPKDTGIARHRDKRVHFYHLKHTHTAAAAAAAAAGIPLLLVHGWPSTPANFRKVLPLLAQQGFDVVAPSIPGYGFSEACTEPGFGIEACADVFHSLMVDVLGYRRFVVQGGDWGSFIGRFIASRHPTAVLAYHTNFPLSLPPAGDSVLGQLRKVWFVLSSAMSLLFGLPPQDAKGFAAYMAYRKRGSGYMAIQSTKPQTLAAGLNDSALGLLSWIAEKHYEWTDLHDVETGDKTLNEVLDPEGILTTVLIYWSTGCILSSMRFYYESLTSNRPKPDFPWLATPTGVLMAEDVVQLPRQWIERTHNVVHFTDVRRSNPLDNVASGKGFPRGGGHFFKMERPETLCKDLTSFVMDTLGGAAGGVQEMERRKNAALAEEQVRFFFLQVFCNSHCNSQRVVIMVSPPAFHSFCTLFALCIYMLPLFSDLALFFFAPLACVLVDVFGGVSFPRYSSTDTKDRRICGIPGSHHWRCGSRSQKVNIAALKPQLYRSARNIKHQ